MYQLALDMGLVDFAITRAIDELSRKHERFNAQDIAAYIGCGEATVKRNLPRLRNAGIITRIKNANGGHRYVFVREAYKNANSR